jgi:hypothetical protein
MLEEKMLESHADVMEKERKKDIMSLLVRARKESLESEPGAWSLSDKAMMDQVVGFCCFCLFSFHPDFLVCFFLVDVLGCWT